MNLFRRNKKKTSGEEDAPGTPSRSREADAPEMEDASERAGEGRAGDARPEVSESLTKSPEEMPAASSTDATASSASANPVEGEQAEAPAEPSSPRPMLRDREQNPVEESIVAVLKTIYDPEIPVDIYELGLVYDLSFDETGLARVRMTLTSPACPVAGSLPGDVERKVLEVPGVTRCEVDLVWDPPWNPSLMSEAARLTLNF